MALDRLKVSASKGGVESKACFLIVGAKVGPKRQGCLLGGFIRVECEVIGVCDGIIIRTLQS
jgi:hypothetical protein